MKKKSAEANSHDLRAHYDFDYAKSRPNRFADRPKVYKGGPVIIDDDVAEVFQTSESVNTVLRSVIRTMRRVAPKSGGPRKRRAS